MKKILTILIMFVFVSASQAEIILEPPFTMELRDGTSKVLDVIDIDEDVSTGQEIYVYRTVDGEEGYKRAGQIKNLTELKWRIDPKYAPPQQQVKQAPGNAVQPLKSQSEYKKDAHQICTQKWTKRGQLDNKMYNHCYEQQMEGYLELIQFHRYADQDWYSKIAYPYCTKKWTKQGVADTRMIAHCLDQENEGIKDVMYYREQHGTEKVNQVVDYALNSHGSWNMTAYEVKKRFDQ